MLGLVMVESPQHCLTTFLLSLDISAAFDTIDHNILLDCISSDFGISGSALGLLLSFVTGRYQ